MQGPSSFTSHHHREVWQGLVGEGEHLPHVEPTLSKPRNPPKTCQTQQLVSGILKVNKSRGALNARLFCPTQRHLPVPPKSEMIRSIRQCAWCQGETSAAGRYHRLTRCGRAPANGAGRLVAGRNRSDRWWDAGQAFLRNPEVMDIPGRHNASGSRPAQPGITC